MRNRNTNVTKYNESNHRNLKRDINIPSIGYKMFRLTSKSSDNV
ncbi:hypothetical protein Desaci_2710 [Desulfosporosinus acidiphilus SJ4]|uniref:Uncharacterized protein n=1 Tax=Desulfosporosinus acidiphilus (strain DSM 22704 / JCM 16185 / SJ4) TaxID=646529 RepID=I4D768_DESAJ|nr:hypothetical protein Desaci_2710 [Desulfosporosinus acidiphilus SJ4]